MLKSTLVCKETFPFLVPLPVSETAMKHEFYADKRDIVKWSVLIQLSKETGIDHIIQVAMLTSELGHGAGKHKLAKNGDVCCEVPVWVWNHFRDLTQIKALGTAANLNIEVVEFPFSNRGAYFGKVAEQIHDIKEPLIILLDPDTGIQPDKTSSQRHVQRADIKRIWDAMTEDSVLVVYQHKPRIREWQKAYRVKLAHACGLDEKSIDTYQSNIASDVALFTVVKQQFGVHSSLNQDVRGLY